MSLRDAALARLPVLVLVTDRWGFVTEAWGRALPRLDADPEGMRGRSLFDHWSGQAELSLLLLAALAGTEVVEVVPLQGALHDVRFVPLRGRGEEAAAGRGSGSGGGGEGGGEGGGGPGRFARSLGGVVATLAELPPQASVPRRREAHRDAGPGDAGTRGLALRDVVHELANPLTPIHAFEAVLAAEREALPTRVQDRLPAMRRSVRVLDRLVADLQEAMRVEREAPGVRARRLDLAPLLQDIVQGFQLHAASRGLTLRLEAGVRLVATADEDRVAQVLANLLHNAVRNTPGGGAVHVEARAAAERGRVEVRVRDTGRGIAPEEQPRLFEPFTRLAEEEAADRRGGTGLGLYICRRLVEAHGGRIWCESAGRGQGSTFAFTLPGAAGLPVEGREPRGQGAEAARGAR